MRLITAHRILIGAAIAFFAFFAAVQLRLYLRSAGTAALVETVVSAAVAVGLVVYYRSLARRWDRPS
ncbi:MAG: hypothetical protein HYR86_08945 [Candidatus Rokubacteria bacterium]|nr:hypothetical protein [Candidatus Rokubacteria bacterium]